MSAVEIHRRTSVNIVEQNAAPTGIRIGVGVAARLVRVVLGIYRTTTVIVLAVAGIAVIYFIKVHAHGLLGGINTVGNTLAIFQEEHRLHILGSLVGGGKVVGE